MMNFVIETIKQERETAAGDAHGHTDKAGAPLGHGGSCRDSCYIFLLAPSTFSVVWKCFIYKIPIIFFFCFRLQRALIQADTVK